VFLHGVISVAIFIIIIEIYKVDDSRVYPKINSNFKTIIGHRLEYLKTKCSQVLSKRKTLLSTTKLLSSHLYWFSKEEIVYCPVFKSASSTWLENLIHVSGANKSLIKQAKQRHKGMLIEQIKHVGAVQPSVSLWSRYVTFRNPQNLIAFIIVRHPFERLVSAYRDKLERMDLPFYRKYGKEIVSTFREKAIETLGKDFFNKSNNYGTLLKVSHGDRPNANLPSFWEFVQSVNMKSNMDEHWMPMNEYCSVCHPVQLQINPYILKFEYLNVEGPEFIRDVGWDQKVNKSTRLNVNRIRDMSSEEITQLYFSVLTEDDILKLYKVYEYDFILFNYTFNIGNLSLPIYIV